MKRRRTTVAWSFLVLSAIGCSEDKPAPPSPPVILNINGVTTPTTPTGVLIEVNGQSFGTAPGSVRFSSAGANLAG